MIISKKVEDALLISTFCRDLRKSLEEKRKGIDAEVIFPCVRKIAGHTVKSSMTVIISDEEL